MSALVPVAGVFKLILMTLSAAFSAPILSVAGQGPRSTALKIDTLHVDLELSSVGWALPLAKGGIVLADIGSKLIYLHAEDGTVSQVGRHGDGPGEYRVPSTGTVRGDSLVVHELGLMRREAIHLITGVGNSRRLVGVGPGLNCRVVLLMDSQGICEEPSDRTSGSPANFLTTRWFRDSSRIEPKVMMVNYDSSYVTRLVHTGGALHVSRPYTWATQSTLTPDGLYAVVMTQVASGNVGLVTVTLWTIATGQTTMFQLRDSGFAVSQDAKRGLAARVVDDLAQKIPEVAARRAAFEAQLNRGWRLTDRTPPYAKVFASSSGCLWLQRARLTWPSDNRSIAYDIVGLDGTMLDRVSAPSHVRLLSVTCEDAFGVATDSDDLPILLRLSR